MKVKKTTRKRIPPPPQAIQRLISSILDASEIDLSQLLDSISVWNYNKTDLYSWVAVLDKFDSIFESFVTKNELSSKFNPGKIQNSEKSVILSILKFSRILIEHATNRSIYSSYDNLNYMLQCADVDIVEQVLRLLSKLAQRLPHNRTMKSEFASAISKSKMQTLCSNWDVKDLGLELVDLGSPQKIIAEEASPFRFQFYRSSIQAQSLEARDTNAVPSTPVRGSSDEGLVNIKIPSLTDIGKGPKDIFSELSHKHNVPPETQFSLFHKIRVFLSLHSPTQRKQLLSIKLLAISVLCYMVNEDISNNTVFLYEPTIIKDLSDLLNPDKHIFWDVRTDALYALNAISHYRSRFQETLNALNASANHGVLTYIFRKLLASMDANEELDFPSEFADAIFNFIFYITTTNAGGNAVISAGMIQTFSRFLSVNSPAYLKIITRCVVLLDNIVYGFTNAMGIFVNADGVNLIVNRVQSEVEKAIKGSSDAMVTEEDKPSSSLNTPEHNDDSKIRPIERAQLIKASVKFIYHMMSGAGASEGLRGLIDGPLPRIVGDIMSRSRLFGSQIYAQATNVLAIFIHNEPTYLAILQELGLPKVFLESIKTHIPASSDAVFCVINALSAICLNAPGLAQIIEAKPLKVVFKILIQEQYIRALVESDVCNAIGSALDELIRHQPALKDDLYEALFETLDGLKVESEKLLSSRDQKFLRNCRIQVLPDDANAEVVLGESFVTEDPLKESQVTFIVSNYIDNLSKLLEGFFIHNNHCKDFIDKGGVDKLMQIYTLSSLPYDFALATSSYSLSHLFRTIGETNSSAIVPSASKEMIPAFEKCRELVDYTGKDSLFRKYVSLPSSESHVLDSINQLYCALITVHGLTGLWSDLYCSQTFSTSRAVGPIIQGLSTDEGINILKEMNRLHRSCVWEHHSFKRSIPKVWLHMKSKKSSDKDDKNSEAAAKEEKEKEIFADPHDVRVLNARHLQFLVAKIPSVLIPLLSGIARMLFPKRSPELGGQVSRIAQVFSDMLVENLAWRRNDEPGTEVIRHHYYSVLFGQMKILFFDESSGQPQILPYLSYTFLHERDGINAIGRSFESLLEDGKAFANFGLEEVKKDELLQDRVNGYYSALENILSLFKRFIDTSVLSDGKFTDFRQVSVHDFIIPVRKKVLECALKLWESRLLSYPCTPSKIARLVISMVHIICEGKDEKSAALDSRTTEEMMMSAEEDTYFEEDEEEEDEKAESNMDLEDSTKEPATSSKKESRKDKLLALKKLKEEYLQEKVQFRSIIFTGAFEILDRMPEAVFEINDIFVLFCEGDAKQVVDRIFTSIHEVHNDQTSTNQSSRLAVRFKLLGIIMMNENVFKTVSVHVAKRVSEIAALVQSESKMDKGSVAEWNERMTAILVVLDRILAFLQIPIVHDVDMSNVEESEKTSVNRVNPLKASEENFDLDYKAFESYFKPFAQYCVEILRFDESDVGLIDAALRVLTVLSRYPNVAAELLEHGASLIVVRACRKSATKGQSNIHNLVTLIIRHFVETPEVLEVLFEEELYRKLVSRSTVAAIRPVDLKSFLAMNDSIALRSQVPFLAAVKKVCSLSRSEIPESPFQISLSEAYVTAINKRLELKKKSEQNISSLASSTSNMEISPSASRMEYDTTNAFTKGIESGVSEAAKKLEKPSFSPVVKHLIEEFMSLGKDPKPKSGEPFESSAEQNEIHFYRCFLLQIMSELASSYPNMVKDVIHFCKTMQASGSKYRNGFLGFILGEVLPFGGITIYPKSYEIYLKKKVLESQWAGNLICALCTDEEFFTEDEELSDCRKLVIENLAKAMKESIHCDDGVDEKYGRLLAYADVIPKILRSKVHLPLSGFSTRNPTESISLAKIMIERKYILILTTMLGEIDLHHPSSKTVVNAILKPLELLSNLSNKLSTAPEAGTGDDIIPPVYDTELEYDDYGGEDEEDEISDEEAYLQQRFTLAGEGQDGEDIEIEIDEEDMDEDGEDDEDEEMSEMEVYNPNLSEDNETASSEDEEEDSDDEMEIVIRPPHEHGLSDDEIVDLDGDQGDEDIEDDDDDNDEDDDEDEVGEEGHEVGVVEGNNDEDADGADDEEDDEDDEEDDEEDEEMDDEDYDEDEMDEGEGVDVDFDAESYEGDEYLVMEGAGAGSDNDERFEMLGGDGGRRRRIRRFGQDEFNGQATFEITFREDVANVLASRNVTNFIDIGGPSSSAEGMVNLNSGNAMFGRHPLLSRRDLEDGRGEQRNIRQFEMPVTNPLQFLENLIMQNTRDVASSTWNYDPYAANNLNGNVGVNSILSSLGRQLIGNDGASSRRNDLSDLDASLLAASRLTVVGCSRRLAQEANALFGSKYGPFSHRLINDIIITLLGKFREEERIRKEEKAKKEEEEQKKRQEEERKRQLEEEEKRKKDAEEAERKMQEEQETKRKLEEEAESLAAKAVIPDDSMDQNTVQEAHEASSSANAEVDANMEAVPSPIFLEEDPGIDPTFLEALPEDLRREVLGQYFDERYQRSRNITGDLAPELSATFLESLPESIRHDVMSQERIVRERYTASVAAVSTEAPANVVAEMDTASFLASLDPELRLQVVMDLDENTIAGLPSNLLAEANAARERLQRRQQAATSSSSRFRSTFRNVLMGTSSSGRAASSGVSSSKKSSQPEKDAMQVVDRQGVLTLTRLIFLPDVLNKRLMLNVIGNVCLNNRTCNDLVITLLIILNEGHVDFNSLEKANTPLSVSKNPAAPASGHHQPNRRRSLNMSRNSKMFQNTLDHLPSMVSQRCIEVLLHLVTSNSRIIPIFLKDCEGVDIPKPNKKPGSKSSKGKERMIFDSRMPLFNLLYLLDRSQFSQTSSVMEPMMQLLSKLTEPLNKIPAITAAVEEGKSGASTPIESTPKSGANAVASGSKPSSRPASAGSNNRPSNKKKGEDDELTKILKAFPAVPVPSLKSLVNCILQGDFTPAAFDSSVSLVRSLCILPESRPLLTMELVSCYSQLFDPLGRDLSILLEALKSKAADVDIQKITLDRFSQPWSSQLKLLRITKVLDHMYKEAPDASSSAKNDKNSSNNGSEAESLNDHEFNYREFDAKTLEVLQQEGLINIWNRMNDCLQEVHEKEELFHVATVLLPLIESFFIICNHFGVGKTMSMGNLAAGKSSSSNHNLVIQSPRAGSPVLSDKNMSMQDRFNTFTEINRKLLNVMIRNNSDLLHGSFVLLVKSPKSLDFDNKRAFFRHQLHKKPLPNVHYGPVHLSIRRDSIFEDSYDQVMRRTGNEFKYGKLNIRFQDEEGVDAGGVTREWYSALARQMFNPDYALFRSSAVDKVTYQPNRSSWVNPDHLSFFRFVGRVIGKAIYDGRVLDCFFTRSFYKHILGISVDYRDMEAIDPEFYKSLEWILKNNITDVLDLTFSTEVDDFGKRKVVDLKPDGRNLVVTEENKAEYVKLITEMRLYLAIQSQIESFKTGFFEIIPKRMVNIFNEQELELLISGLPDIDVDDWKNNTEYQGYTNSSPQISWFWRCVRSMSQEERAKLLQFVTGTSKVPLEGFKSLQGSSGVQRFQIHKEFGSTNRLPSAHTCFNQLDLPMYETYESLREYLMLAINECAGFGFS